MNSKKLAILAILGLLIVGGAIFGVYTKKMNTEGFRGIGFPVKGVEKEQVDDWMKTFEAVFAREDVLQEIVKRSEYSTKLSVPEGEAVGHLKNCVEVNYSASRNSVQIGLRGMRKQNTELDQISKIIFNVSAPVVAQIKPAFGQHYQSLSQATQ